MKKIKSIKFNWKSHRLALFLFSFLMIYNFVVSGNCKLWQVNEITYAYHAVDYSMGFCSRFLPGAIYNFLFDEISYFRVSLYETVLMILLFAAVSIFLEKVIVNVSEDYRKTALITILFFLTGPCTFSMYIKEFGMLDVYWLYISVILFVCLFQKKLYFLIIPLFLAAVLVHFSAVLCFVPFFIIVILYRISCIEQKREKKLLLVSLLFAVTLAISLFFYLLFFERRNLTYSVADFNEALNSRGVSYFWYYDYVLYRYTAGYSFNNPNIVTISGNGSVIRYFIDTVIQQILINFEYITVYDKILAIFLVFPVVLLIMKFLHHMIKKNSDNKLKKFSFICMALLFFATLFCGCLFSTDIIRWLGHAFLPLFASFILVLYSEGNDAWEYIKTDLNRIPTAILTLFFMLYCVSVFDPYS